MTAARGRGHDAQRGGYQELRFDDASFDLIHVYDVIEHVPDPIDLLRCAARWVKPGGVVLITTPEHECVDRWLFRDAWGVYGWGHWHIFGRASFARAAAAADLRIEHVAHYPRATSWIWSCHAALVQAGLPHAAERLFPAHGMSTVARPGPWSIALLTAFTALDYACLAATRSTSDAEYVLRRVTS